MPSNNQHLKVISQSSDQVNNNKYLERISGLTLVNNNAHLKAITGGVGDNVHLARLWCGCNCNSFNQCLEGLAGGSPDNGEGVGSDLAPVQVIDGAKAKQVFNNDGTDYIGLGRPQWWLDKFNPLVDEFTIKLKVATTNGSYVIGFSNTAGVSASRGFIINLNNGVGFRILMGDMPDLTMSSSAIANQIADITYSYSPTSGHMLNLNGVVTTSTAQPTTYNPDVSTNLILNGRGDGTIGNWSGIMNDVEFYEGFTSDGDVSGLTPIECFPLDEGAGTKVYGSILNTEGTITDGVPQSVWQYKFMDDESGNGNYALLNNTNSKIELNPSGNVNPIDYTNFTYPPQGTENTIAELGAQNFPKEFYTENPSRTPTQMKYILYPPLNNHDAIQQNRCENYVGRG